MSEINWDRSGHSDQPFGNKGQWAHELNEVVAEVNAAEALFDSFEWNPFASLALSVLKLAFEPSPLNPKTYEPPNYRMQLKEETSTIEEVLEAIRVTKEAIEDIDKASDAHGENSSRAREQIKLLEEATKLARKFRETADESMRAFRQTDVSLKRELSWLQDMYTAIITRGQNEAALNRELEFFESLARDRPWGSKAYDFQLEGAQQMALEQRVVLADEMGLGKTLSSIMACDMSRAARVLVVTQNDIVSNFAREVSKWAPDRPVIALGTIKDKFSRNMATETLKGQPAFVVLINYEMWRRDSKILKKLIDLQFDTVIIDEVHNIKDEKGNNFKGVASIVYAENKNWECNNCGYEFIRWPWSDLCDECGKPLGKRSFNDRCSVKRVYPLTGTPILNEPADAFPMLHLIDRIAFPDKRSYLERYCIQREVESLTGTMVNKWFFKYGGEKMLNNRLGAKFIRRTLDDSGIVLPPQDEQIHTLSFEEGEYVKQRQVIKAINDYNQVLLNEMREAINIPGLLAMLTRLRQAVTFPAGIKFYAKGEDGKPMVIGQCDVTESIKVDYSMKLIKELLEAGQKVVLFSQFNAPLIQLQRLLNAEGITRVERYDGGIDQKKLDWIATQADAGHTKREDMEFDILLVNYKKGATGVNFTNFRQTILMDREWNPAKEDQAEARTHRIGQTEETTVHILELEDSIDDGIRQLMARKSGVVEGFNSETERFSLIEYLERKFKES